MLVHPSLMRSTFELAERGNDETGLLHQTRRTAIELGARFESPEGETFEDGDVLLPAL